MYLYFFNFHIRLSSPVPSRPFWCFCCLSFVGRKNQQATNRNVYLTLNTVVIIWIDNESFVCIDELAWLYMSHFSIYWFGTLCQRNWLTWIRKRMKKLDSITNRATSAMYYFTMWGSKPRNSLVPFRGPIRSRFLTLDRDKHNDIHSK